MDLPPPPIRLACAKVGATKAATVRAMTLAVVRKEVITVCFLKVNPGLKSIRVSVAGREKITKHRGRLMRNKL